MSKRHRIRYRAQGPKAKGASIAADFTEAESASEAKPAPSLDQADLRGHGAPLSQISSSPAPTLEGEASTKSTIVGFVNFDGRSADGNVTQVLIDAPYISHFRRGRYVTVENYTGSAVYLGRVIEGPYFSPDFVSLDSSIARVAIQKAASISMLPDYHALASVEILGQIVDGALLGLNTRPLPKSKVTTVDGQGLVELLRIDGDVALGRLDGYEHIPVNMRSDAKIGFPRNVGIFGTVGSGKTNTAQVLIEQLSAAGWAVVVLDVEGEYTRMNQPTNELVARLHAVGKKPQGLGDFRVLYPVNHEPEDREKGTAFSINFGALPPAMLAEIVGMNDAQQERFFQLYDACVRANLFGEPTFDLSAPLKPKKQKKPRAPIIGPASAADDVESRSKVEATAHEFKAAETPFDEDDALSELELGDAEAFKANVSLQQLMKKLLRWLRYKHDDTGQEITGPSASSFQKVKSQLRGIHRLGIFSSSAAPIAIDELLVKGRVTVLDLSESSDPRVNNLVIADVLRAVFEYKKNNPDPKVMLLIEEAHTFVSRESVRQMQATMDKLREIARRGRKRWLGLTFISQQPSHLPAELYELCNTLFVHETNGRRNIDALKGTAGTVNEGIWKDISVLGQGRSVVISPQFRHPVVVQVDPCTSMRRHIS